MSVSLGVLNVQELGAARMMSFMMTLKLIENTKTRSGRSIGLYLTSLTP